LKTSHNGALKCGNNIQLYFKVTTVI